MRRKGVLTAVCVLAALTAMLTAMKVIKWNEFIAARYEVRGVDVSHYQGEIDFDCLAHQGMRFAFIKATEGSSHIDERFAENFAAASEAPLRAGFYHFFSYDSEGVSQAANYIANVSAKADMLPPVIDVEFYGTYLRRPADAQLVQPQLRTMVDALEAHYGVKPIIYCTMRAYRMYIEGAFDDCDLWIRSVYFAPDAGIPWMFWQYTDDARLDGYAGEESRIDVNVFRGSEEDFKRYGAAR